MSNHFSASIRSLLPIGWEDGDSILSSLAGEHRGEVWFEDTGDARSVDSNARSVDSNPLVEQRDRKQDWIAVEIQCAGTWTIVLITASSDEAMIALAKALRLGATEVVHGKGRWWRRATGESDQRALRVVVAGPHHLVLPPA